MAESEEELKSLLRTVKVESEKVGFKLKIQKTKIMASGPITSWQIDEETVETVTDFISGVSKSTADGDCSHEIKTLIPWKESYDLPRQHIKKQRHYFAAHQASLSITTSRNLFKLMSIELVKPSNHLSHYLSSPSPPTFNLSQHQGLFK